MNLQTFKAETIQQFYLLEHLRKNFAVDSLKSIELVDRFTILAIDPPGVAAHFIYRDKDHIECRVA